MVNWENNEYRGQGWSDWDADAAPFGWGGSQDPAAMNGAYGWDASFGVPAASYPVDGVQAYNGYDASYDPSSRMAPLQGTQGASIPSQDPYVVQAVSQFYDPYSAALPQQTYGAGYGSDYSGACTAAAQGPSAVDPYGAYAFSQAQHTDAGYGPSGVYGDGWQLPGQSTWGITGKIDSWEIVNALNAGTTDGPRYPYDYYDYSDNIARNAAHAAHAADTGRQAPYAVDTAVAGMRPSDGEPAATAPGAPSVGDVGEGRKSGLSDGNAPAAAGAATNKAGVQDGVAPTVPLTPPEKRGERPFTYEKLDEAPSKPKEIAGNPRKMRKAVKQSDSKAPQGAGATRRLTPLAAQVNARVGAEGASVAGHAAQTAGGAVAGIAGAAASGAAGGAALHAAGAVGSAAAGGSAVRIGAAGTLAGATAAAGGTAAAARAGSRFAASVLSHDGREADCFPDDGPRSVAATRIEVNALNFKEMPLRNLIFSLFIFIFLCGPALIFANENLIHADLPEWLSPERSKYMTGSLEEPEVESNFTTEQFQGGSLQENIDEALSRSIPARAGAITVSSSLQRQFVKASNLLLGYEGIPSNFDFTVVDVPSLGCVLPLAEKKTPIKVAAYQTMVDTVNGLAERHPDVNFVYHQLCDVNTTKWNPTQELMSDVIDEAWIKENVVDKIDDRVTTIVETIEKPEDLSNLYFTTEHHETLEKALQSYNWLAETLDLEPATYNGNTLVSSHWAGSTARTGADFDYQSTLHDDSTKTFDDLWCTVDAVEEERGFRTSFLQGEAFPNRYLSEYFAYHEYYGYTEMEVIWRNEGENNGKVLLFIDQSYGVPLEPYLAENYAMTIVLSPINRYIYRSFDWYINELHVDDVVFQFGMSYFDSIFVKNPALFGWYGMDQPPHLIKQHAEAVLYNFSKAHKPQLIPRQLSVRDILGTDIVYADGDSSDGETGDEDGIGDGDDRIDGDADADVGDTDDGGNANVGSGED